MKLCKCNHCGGIFEDMNPQTVSKEYPDTMVVEPLIKFYDVPSDLSTGFWGCPICCTDGWLQDKIHNDTEIEVDAIKARLASEYKLLSTLDTDNDVAREYLQNAISSLSDCMGHLGNALSEFGTEWEPVSDPETKVFNAMQGGTDGG